MIGQFQRPLNEFTTANAGNALTLNFDTNGVSQAIPLTAANCTLVLVPPRIHTPIYLRFVQDSTGGRTVSFPGAVIGIANLNLNPNASTFLELYYNGTNYYLTGGSNANLPDGSIDGYVLTTHGAGSTPTWTPNGNLIVVNDNSVRDAIISSYRKEGMIVYSKRTQCYYSLAPDLTTWNIVASNPALGTQAAWYVNTGFGNDNNDGTVSNPIKTLTELSNRLCPFGATRTIYQNTNVYIGAGSYPELLFLCINGPFNFNINGTVTSSSNITLSSVTNTSPGSVTIGSGTRGQIATASGTFVSGQMLRSVSGSNVGAIAYVQSIIGDSQHAYVTHWHIANPVLRSTQVDLTTGDAVVIDTLVTFIGNISLEQRGASVIRIKNFAGVSGSINYAFKSESPYGIMFDACIAGFANNAANGEGSFTRCQGGWFGIGGYVQYFGGNHFTNNYIYSHSKIDFSGGDCISGSGFQFYDCDVQLGLDWAAQSSSYGIQFENNGSVTSLAIGGNSTFVQGFNLPLWGVTGTTTVGIEIKPNATFSYTNLPTINAVTPMHSGNLNFSAYQAFSLPGYNSYSIDSNSSTPSDVTVDGYLRFPVNGTIKTNNLSLLNLAPSYQSMSGGLYIAEDTANPSGNPTGGAFLYVNNLNHHPTIRTQDGYIVDLTASSTLDNSSAAYVAAWYVNASTGNDGYDGKTALTAFKTTNRLSQVLCPGGSILTIQQSTVVNIAAGTYETLELNIRPPTSSSSFTFEVKGDYTSSSAMTISSVVDTTTSTRGRITTSSGTFTDKCRIRSTSGASVGAITYCTGLNSSTDAYVKSWFLDSSLAGVNIANGTTCVVDTLQVTIGRCRIVQNGARIKISDIILANGVDWLNTITGSAVNYLNQCIIGGVGPVPRLSGNIQCRNCRFPSTASFLNLMQIVLWGCVIEDQIAINNSADFEVGNCFNGGFLSLNPTRDVSNNVYLYTTEWTNGSGKTAVQCKNVNITGNQFGFGTPYDVGFSILPGYTVHTASLSYLGMPATIPISIAGYSFNYSDAPISLPAYNAHLVTDTHPANIINDGYYGFLKTVTNPSIYQFPTTSNVGSSLNISSQSAAVTGGDLIVSSGNGSSAGAQGRIKVSMGGYIGGTASGTGLQMIELANLGTTALPASVLSLCNNASMSTSLLTGTFGNGVIYLGRASTQPVPGATPVNGTLIYSGINGEFCTRDGYGVMNLGDAQTGITLNYNVIGSGSFKIIADSRLQLEMQGSGGLDFYDQNFVMKYGGTPSINAGTISITGNPGGFSIVGRNNTNSTGIGGGLSLRAGSATSGTGVGGTLTLEPGIGFDGTTANGNIGIGLRSSSYNFQSMANGIMINTANAAPTGNPTGGFFLWVDPSDGKLKARGPSGTVTDVALP